MSPTSPAAVAEKGLQSGEISAMIKNGFLSPTYSPPPSTTTTPSSPKPSTLFEMISKEDSLSRPPPPSPLPLPVSGNAHRLRSLISRLTAEVTSACGPGDVNLSITSREGLSISIKAHRRVLIDRSRFFKEKLSGSGIGDWVTVSIFDCDDVEAYLEVLAMMYCHDLKKKLTGEEVSRVLEFLKVCLAIMFDNGVNSCLNFLEAAPWSEDEAGMIVSVLRSFHLHDRATMVLQRINTEPANSMRTDDVLLRLLSGVLQAKNEKARQEMKSLLAALIGDNDHNIEQCNVSLKKLYDLCNKCLSSLQLCLSDAKNTDERQRDRGVLMGEIAREADNMRWLVEILISRKMADEFVTLWADQKELASMHSNALPRYRFEISSITARLCVALGQGQVLVSGDAKHSLLQTWLEPLYEDYFWLRRASRAFDQKMVEDGLSETILTLSMTQQEAILLRWFDLFLNKGDDCPNIQKALKVWWQRAFIKLPVVNN
ncbi:BTB/POZ domain-containing protein [Dioscorea alata]|uniref:BTB/POZ domain-containing protein n=1 Tax=Dioscorea alata TaxID=55571 RepID=A0ACB7VG31_DIOAL|nr:BTB/POZ domain-containing protein [Dioscorea alata]